MLSMSDGILERNRIAWGFGKGAAHCTAVFLQDRNVPTERTQMASMQRVRSAPLYIYQRPKWRSNEPGACFSAVVQFH